MLPFRFDDPKSRFDYIRGWAKRVVGEDQNRCAICMGYTLRLTPHTAEGDASLADIPGMSAKLNSNGGPGSPNGLAGSADKQLFIRAAELLPRVRGAFGPANVEGVASVVWTQLQWRSGVVYIEDCYETKGDKRLNAVLPDAFAITSGDHWDLFNGYKMIAEDLAIAGNHSSSKLYFWQARDPRPS